MWRGYSGAEELVVARDKQYSKNSNPRSRSHMVNWVKALLDSIETRCVVKNKIQLAILVSENSIDMLGYAKDVMPFIGKVRST